MKPYPYPHTITNGGGEELTFMRIVQHPNGDRLEVENTVSPGAGPPMHVHYHQEEALTVAEGRMGYQYMDGEPRYAGPGETVVFKAGEVHRFWNAGDDMLRCTGYVSPPDNLEYFLTQIFDAQRRGGGHRPGMMDASFLTWRYRSEFGMTEIPAFVRQTIIPLQFFIGKVFGLHRKFAGAPEPVRR